MKLLTKAIKAAFEKQGDTSELDASEIKVIVKYFNPQGSGTWYAVEFDPEEGIFQGYVTGLGFDEFGAFTLDELEGYKGRLGLGIERDLYFGEHTLREIRDGARP